MNTNTYCNNQSGCISFPIQKIDSETGSGIGGAVFEMRAKNGLISIGETNADGILKISLLPCSTFELREVSPPAGYAPTNRVYNIVVDECCRVSVDGVLTSSLIIENAAVGASFTALKRNIENEMPLEGAVYTLYMNSTAIASASSNPLGQMTFSGLFPGAYELVETTPPPGFMPNAERYAVEVTNGTVTINGQPANGYVLYDTPLSLSAPPTINSVLEGASVIAGNGIAGSAISVTLPGGQRMNATVTAGGSWTANVPAGVNLAAGDIVSANQTEPGKAVSSDVHTIVISNTDVEPGIDVFVSNLSTGEDYAVAGDVILYDVIVSNNGTPSSTWQSAYATFSLSDAVTLQIDSIRVNNMTIPSSQYEYDSDENTLTIYLGNIPGGSSMSIAYRVTVNDYIEDLQEIVLDVILGSQP